MNRRSFCLGVALVLCVAAGACGSDAQPSTTDTTVTPEGEGFTDTGQTSVAEPSIWIRRTSDMEQIRIVGVAQLALVDEKQQDADTWVQFVEAGFPGTRGLAASDQGEVSVGGIGRGVGQRDCSRSVNLLLAGADEGYREVLRVHPNFCGVIQGDPFIEVSPDRVVTGQQYHNADFDGVEGAVVVNGPGQHGVAPDQSVPVAMDESFRDQVLDHICVDVTVRSGAGGPDGTVGARIELLADGVPIEILYYRADETAERVPLVEQKPHSVVMYPMGSVRTSEGVPDTLRVDTTAGIIESWEATARGCGSGGSRL